MKIACIIERDGTIRLMAQIHQSKGAIPPDVIITNYAAQIFVREIIPSIPEWSRRIVSLINEMKKAHVKSSITADDEVSFYKAIETCDLMQGLTPIARFKPDKPPKG